MFYEHTGYHSEVSVVAKVPFRHLEHDSHIM